MRPSISLSAMVSMSRTAMPGLLKKVFSWRNMTVSPPSLTSYSPVPTETVRIGGALASESCSLASADMVGHFSSSALPAARAMAKARQVGKPHSPQFVLGRSLNIWIPVSAIVSLLYIMGSIVIAGCPFSVQ